MMKEKAEMNKKIQMPNQKYCQNPPDSTTVVITAEKIQSIPVTTKPMSFAIVVASGILGRRFSLAGTCERLIFIKSCEMQVAGHTLSGVISRCFSNYYAKLASEMTRTEVSDVRNSGPSVGCDQPVPQDLRVQAIRRA